MRKTAVVLGCFLSLLEWNPAVAQEAFPQDVLLFSDDFDGEPEEAWALDGLWNLDGTPSSMPGGAAFSGKKSLNYNSGANYQTGSSNSGAALSPWFNIPVFQGKRLSFQCNYRTETTGTQYDRRKVKIHHNGKLVGEYVLSASGSSSPLGNCGPMGVWHHHSLELPPLAKPGDIVIMIAHSMRVEFEFDSVDAEYNGYPGWFVDDVRVTRLNTVPVPIPKDDHGNAWSEATQINPNGEPLSGSIEKPGDVDFFSISTPIIMLLPGAKPPVYKYTVETFDLSSSMDSVLTVYANLPSNKIGQNDDAAGLGYGSRVTWTSALNGDTFFLKVEHYSKSKTGTYKIRAKSEFVPQDDDHGNSSADATLLPANQPVGGKIEKPGDVDFFRIEVPAFFLASNTVLETSDLSSGMDTFLTLYDSTGKVIGYNDDAPGMGTASRISKSLPKGTYYVRVRHYSSSGTGSYTITLKWQTLVGN